jgi:hypothetical protein
LTSLHKALISVDQILRIMSFELSEILLDISGNIKAEYSALKEIHNHLTAKTKFEQKKANAEKPSQLSF